MGDVQNLEEEKNVESIENEEKGKVVNAERKINNDKKNKIKSGNNEERYPKQTMWIKWINTFVTGASAICAIVISIVSYVTVKEIQYEFSQQQSQFQTQYNDLTNTISQQQTQFQEQINVLQNTISQQQTQFQEQINTIENVIEQNQYVDVIQARDNDILIKTNDGKWIVIPMLAVEDISIPDRIIEYRHSSAELSTEDFPKKGLFDIDENKISTNDTFTYKVPTISINPNKLMSLSIFIENIFVEFNIYTNDGLQKYTTDKEEIDFDNSEYDNVFLDVMLPYQYVTDKALDVLNGGNGINKIKLSVVIEYKISETDTFKIPYTQDTFCEIDEA